MIDHTAWLGQTRIGTFLKITDPAVVEIAGLAGLDFVIIDMEHGPAHYESAQQMVRAAECKGIRSVIRVGELSQIMIQRALDIGADGVQVPQINNREDALRCVEYARFHPLGKRGVCRYVRAANYTGMEKQDYFRNANRKLVVVHIEGLEGINNLEEILDTEGIDVFFLGPYDLSQSCGVPGEVKHPLVVEKMQGAIQLAKKMRRHIGTFTDETEDVRYWKNLGVTYIAHSVDVGIFYRALSEIKNQTDED